MCVWASSRVQPALERPDVATRRLSLGQHRLDLGGVVGVDGDVPEGRVLLEVRRVTHAEDHPPTAWLRVRVRVRVRARVRVGVGVRVRLGLGLGLAFALTVAQLVQHPRDGDVGDRGRVLVRVRVRC